MDSKVFYPETNLKLKNSQATSLSNLYDPFVYSSQKPNAQNNKLG